MAGRLLSPAGVMAHLKNSKGFDNVLKKVNILTAEKGKCTAELKIEEDHTNPMGGLHGGLSATLVDCISTYALMSDEKLSVPNVSVDMHLTYIKGATIGDTIVIDAKTVKAGKTLAFLDVLISKKDTGDVLVKGVHTKFLKR